MKITIYELLGMIKENKDLPKKIKYGNVIYVLQENREDYATWLYDNLDLLNDVILGHFNIEDAIYLELEILEEKKEIPEKLSNIKFENGKFYLPVGNKHNYIIREVDKVFLDKINEIIDYLESKGEE